VFLVPGRLIIVIPGGRRESDNDAIQQHNNAPASTLYFLLNRVLLAGSTLVSGSGDFGLSSVDGTDNVLEVGNVEEFETSARN